MRRAPVVSSEGTIGAVALAEMLRQSQSPERGLWAALNPGAKAPRAEQGSTSPPPRSSF